MSSVREFLQTGPGRALSTAIIAIGLSFAAYRLWESIRPNPGVNESRYRWFVNVETGKPFKAEIVVGQSNIMICPDTGKRTGYPAELCYWTADGEIKSDPDKVVLNQAQGKPGPTFCPFCHRLVVMHNPMPQPGDSPPPTEAEWHKQHQQFQ